MADIQAVASRVCGQIPEGWEVQLCMERGAAWVTLRDTNGDFHPLPDSADKSIEEQINDALDTATRVFEDTPFKSAAGVKGDGNA